MYDVCILYVCMYMFFFVDHFFQASPITYAILCYVLPSTLCKFLCFQSSFLTRVKFLVLLCSFILPLCLYKSSKLIEFTNF